MNVIPLRSNNYRETTVWKSSLILNLCIYILIYIYIYIYVDKNIFAGGGDSLVKVFEQFPKENSETGVHNCELFSTQKDSMVTQFESCAGRCTKKQQNHPDVHF